MKLNCDGKVRTMRFAGRVFGVLALVLMSIEPSARAQAGDDAPAGKTTAAPKQDGPSTRVDTRPMQTFYLNNVSQQNEANEVVIAVRNLLPPDVRVYLVPTQNAIVMRANPEELALTRKLLDDLDRPKKTYRLTYTVTETDSGKRIGIQHFAMVVVTGQRTVLKQGSKVPIATGSYSEKGSSEAQTQFTYLDIGTNFDASLDEFVNGVRLRTKVEQLSVAEQMSGVGLQDPIIRQSSLEGTSFLTPGKPLVLGSIDVPGSTRHLDVEVVMEAVK